MKQKMKYLIVTIALLLVVYFESAAQIKISQLPSLSAPDSSADYIPIVHSGTTYKITPGKLFHEFGASGGSGSPGGSNTQIQFNNSGAFGASADFTWDNSAKILTSEISGYKTLLIDPSSGLFQFGFMDYSGGGLEFNQSTHKVTLSSGEDNTPVSGTKGTIEILPTYVSLKQGTGNVLPLRFYENPTNGSNYTGFQSPASRSADLIYTLPSTDPTSGQVLSSGAPSGGVATLSWVTAGTGTVTSIATTSPITGGTITTTGTIGINDAAADGSTKGAAAFTAADFNSSSGLISIDYTNAQKATTSTIGFLTDTDWDTFNDKVGTGVTTLSSLASVGTITTGTWNASVIAGQYGGTGVANTGKTLTLSGNTTLGSGSNTVTIATTGNSSVTLPTAGTLATLDGSETFTNKSIVATQLTGTAYTFAANNTNATAAYTLNHYEDHPLATYSGTVSFNSTPPSSITSQQYAWSRIGNTVTLFFSIFYGSAGTTNTSATITLPSDCPSPATFSGAGDAASEYIFPINGARVEANMTANPSAVRGGLRRNAANDGYEIALIFGSVSAAQCQFTISYRVN